MKKIAIKSHQRENQNWGATPYIIGVILFITFLVMLIGPSLANQANHAFVIGAIFCLAIFGLYKNMSVAKQKTQCWRELVERTNLDYQVGGAFLGYPVYLEGVYRGRSILLKNNGDKGIFQIPSTQIEIDIGNSNNASFRLRGPYPGEKDSPSDDIITSMFSASKLKQFGQERRFFIGASHIHLTTSILSMDTLQEKLKMLPYPVNIVLDRQKLYIDHPGLLYEAEYLCFLLDLVSEIANAIERTANTRLMLAAAAH